MALESRTFTYQAELEWDGGRRSHVSAGDRPEVIVAPPSEFPGGESDQWSPEHLFLASLQSCTMLSFLAHCAHNGVEVVSYRSHATGELARRDQDRRYAFRRVLLVVAASVAGGPAGVARGPPRKAQRGRLLSGSAPGGGDT